MHTYALVSNDTPPVQHACCASRGRGQGDDSTQRATPLLGRGCTADQRALTREGAGR